MSEKCVAMAQGTQEALFEAKELDSTMEDMALWVHARVVPLKWQRQVLTHLKPIYQQMTFCRDELVRGWGSSIRRSTSRISTRLSVDFGSSSGLCSY